MNAWGLTRHTDHSDSGLFSLISYAPARDARTRRPLLSSCDASNDVLDLEVNHYQLFDLQDEESWQDYETIWNQPFTQGPSPDEDRNYTHSQFDMQDFMEEDEMSIDWFPGDEFDYLRIAPLQYTSSRSLDDYLEQASRAGVTAFSVSDTVMCYARPALEAFDRVASNFELVGGVDARVMRRARESDAYKRLCRFDPDTAYRQALTRVGRGLLRDYRRGASGDEVIADLVDAVVSTPLQMRESLKILQRFVPGDLLSYEQEFFQVRLGVATELYEYARTARDDIERSLSPVIDDLRNQHV